MIYVTKYYGIDPNLGYKKQKVTRYNSRLLAIIIGKLQWYLNPFIKEIIIFESGEAYFQIFNRVRGKK